MFDRARILGQRPIDDGLEVDVLALPEGHVGGENQAGAGGTDPVPQGARSETSEDDRMDRADPDGREHGDDGLGAGRHVDGQAVAPIEAESTQGGRGTLDLSEQLRITERPPAAALVERDKRRTVAAPGRHVPVERVLGEVRVAAGEPPERRRLGLFEDTVGRRGPLDQLGRLAPEGVRVLERAPMEGVVAAARLDSRIVGHGSPPVVLRWSQAHRVPSNK